MAQLVTQQQRYTLEEWKTAGKYKHKTAEIDRAKAERLMAESQRLDFETREQSDTTLNDVNKKMDQRIVDIKYWKAELEQKLDGIYKEIDTLECYKTRVEKAIESVQEPLHIAETSLANRERRKEIDVVNDAVQKELQNEIQVEKAGLDTLKKLHEQVVEQLRLNRKAKYNVECDLKDKFNAMSIDEYVRDIDLTNPNIYLKNGAAKIEPHSFNEVQWETFSENNLQATEATRLKSSQLRNNVDTQLQKVANTVTKQIELTNRALERRIWEEKDAKAKLETQIKDVTKTIDDIEENIKNLERAIADKDAYLKLAHTRLDTRTNRPNIELVRDPAQYKLVQEVKEIEASVAALRARLAESHRKLKDLDRHRLILNKDLEVKINTIKIDEAENFNGIRKSLVINQF